MTGGNPLALREGHVGRFGLTDTRGSPTLLILLDKLVYMFSPGPVYTPVLTEVKTAKECHG